MTLTAQYVGMVVSVIQIFQNTRKNDRFFFGQRNPLRSALVEQAFESRRKERGKTEDVLVRRKLWNKRGISIACFNSLMQALGVDLTNFLSAPTVKVMIGLINFLLRRDIVRDARFARRYKGH